MSKRLSSGGKHVYDHNCGPLVRQTTHAQEVGGDYRHLLSAETRHRLEAHEAQRHGNEGKKK